jgi:hypothetical protein
MPIQFKAESASQRAASIPGYSCRQNENRLRKNNTEGGQPQVAVEFDSPYERAAPTTTLTV